MRIAHRRVKNNSKEHRVVTLSYSSGPASAGLLGDTIAGNFATQTEKTPNLQALVDLPTGRSWTYAELDQDADRLAAALMERGLKKGDRIGIFAQNIPEWVLTMYAAAKLGVIIVNINPAYREHELEFILEHSGATMLISQVSAPPHIDFVEVSRAVAAKLENLSVVYVDTSHEPTAIPMKQHEIAPEEKFSALLEAGERLLADEGAKVRTRIRQITDSLSCDEPINLQYTSGTTGFPKGVTLTHHNILNNGYLIGENLAYAEEDTVVLPVPFFHCFGMVIGILAAFSHGSTAVIPSAGFEPSAALSAVEKTKATSLYGVPTMFIAELELSNFDDYDLSTLRTGVMAGSTCPVEVMRAVIERMHMSEVAICYGMTETAPVSTMTRVDDSLEARTETVGTVMPHTEVKVVDPVTGETLPRGQKGEVCTRGYCVMKGYWNQPDKTAEVLDADGWMHTGDLGIMNEAGYLDISGRIKDMVIRGGENVYPREIEEFLYTHPSIRDVQVVGVPDPKYGEELMAWVILREGVETLTTEDVREFAQGKLAHYKIPRYVEVRESFPMTVSGKIRKVELRAEGAEIVSAG